ncbi:MAG: hypothetical protein WA446_02820 [Steroidobacteraceae bacterium]
MNPQHEIQDRSQAPGDSLEEQGKPFPVVGEVADRLTQGAVRLDVALLELLVAPAAQVRHRPGTVGLMPGQTRLLRVLSDLISGVGLTFRQRGSLEAEVLFLRRQLALYAERRVKPRRLDAATRVSLAVLSRLFEWRSIERAA